MSVVKVKICHWQNYLHHFSKMKSSLSMMQNEIFERMLDPNIDDLNDEFGWILELQSQLTSNLKSIAILEKVANELADVLKNPVIEEHIQNQVTDFKHQIGMEVEILLSRKTGLDKINQASSDLISHFKTCQEKLSSMQLYMIQDIPSPFEEIGKELEQAEVVKIANEEVLETLYHIDHRISDERTVEQNTLQLKAAAQKNFCWVIYCTLHQHIYAFHRNLDITSTFEKKFMVLMKWSEKMERKIKQEFTDSCSNAINKLNEIQEEINSMKQDFDNAVNQGNMLLCHNEIMDNISEKISILNSRLSHVTDLNTHRLETVGKISKCLENLSDNSKKLDSFLLSAESSLELCHNVKDLPYEEIKRKIHNLKILENEFNTFEEVVGHTENLLKEMDSYDDNLNSNSIKNVLQYCQSVLIRWLAFKTVVSKQLLSLQNAKSIWNQFLNALEELEKWLICKEEIASKINYCDPGHSRNTYLDGVAVFEKLNHCFQDDIQVLHSVNSCFHNISKQEFNISSMKTRVLAANDQWHKLYKKVTEVFGTVKNILQIWDHFDHLKEHLLLFLTETDLKLTELETTSSFELSVYGNIEEDFKLHEDEKERFLDTANHLMKQSECSVSIIQASIDEVESYWHELYKRLFSLKNVSIHTVEKENVTHQYADSKHIKFISVNEHTEEMYGSSIPSTDVFDAENSQPDNTMGKCDKSSEYHQTEMKTYSEVVAMNARKVNESKVKSECITLKDQSVTDSTLDKEHQILSEKQIVTPLVRSKQKSFDDECTKDLLAALKEAEERMNSLEGVLSEITPSGIDEQGPNYSHLLAACRSSVDVIQHLSQFLFYDVSHENDETEKNEIKLQSEDLLLRWQKIENLALNKESRVIDNRKSWENFSKELKGFETWIQKALHDYNTASCTDADLEKLAILLQKHKELISEIRAQKKNVLTLNITGEKLLNASGDSSKTESLKQRIKTVNDHWDNLYSVALLWQNKLQSEFLQSSEFRSSINEMKLWLMESEKKVDEMALVKEKDGAILHKQHTELFALKQQLEVYCNRLETLLEITLHLFLPELSCDENLDLFEARLTELQTELKSNLKMSQSLLIKCTEMLKSVSSLLGFSKFREHISHSQNGATSVSQTGDNSTDRTECCSFLMRVARASFPIQAILLLLLGAAILLPMEEEEELSCRLSNNFAASLNPMLRYPDGPPPV